MTSAAARFRYASDRGVYVDFDSTGDVERFLGLLDRGSVEGIENLHPAYRSVLVIFDPLSTDHERLEADLEPALAALDEVTPEPGRTIEIPVRYGGLDGPDLDDVAALHGIPSARVIELHSMPEYRVDFLGFVPGFAYLSGLPQEIATPRLAQPRTNVPAGSVGIAGNQTGVYPFVTPGGWRLIGRTEAKMFETGRREMSLLRLGDRVRFIPA